jgi:integrase/recombinase XerD
MSALRERFLQYMRIRGFAKKTLDSYLSAVVELSKAYNTAPDKLSNEQIQAHVDHLIRDRKLSWNTVNVHVSAFQCFYREVLGRPATGFFLPPRGRSRKRPIPPDRDSVRKILEAPRCLKHKALLALTYGSGLRVSEVVALKPCHIESAPDRMMVRVEQGKGHKDRYTILSRHSLALLREYWLEYRPTDWLFFGFDRTRAMSRGTAQQIFYKACDAAGIVNRHGIHSLRHAFATHLLEQGTDLLVIKRCLGHSSLSTTAVYCHITSAHLQNVRSPADVLFEKP